jgi:hypothetical protein
LLPALLSGLLLLFASPAVSGDVELFDTDREQVVKIYANSLSFQQEAKEILHSVSGRVLELSPSLEKALILKIPLSPPQDLTVASAAIDAQIVEMFVVMPKRAARPPWLILHTADGDSLLLEFARGAGQVERLMKEAQQKGS